MATRKRRRKSTARPAAARRTSNTTTRRRRRVTRSRQTNPTVFSGRRRSPRRRSVSRGRNPSTGSLANQALGLAAGITVVGLAQGFVPPIGGLSPVAVAARQAATGWLIGEGMQRFGVMRGYAAEVKIGGLALGIGTLINAWVLPTITSFLRPAPKPVANGNGNGMADIVTMPRGEWDDYYGSTPQFRTNPGNGMGGVVTIPRRNTGY